MTTLYKTYGSNKITGTALGETLDGGLDYYLTLSGGAGNDNYFINSTTTVIENKNEGIDKVVVNGRNTGFTLDDFSTYTLPANVEDLYAVGSSSITASGNSLDNTMMAIATSFKPVTFFGYAGNDSLSGAEGKDSLKGGTGNDDLDGHGGDDSLYGEAGNDYLAGYEGVDYLDGGAGNDMIFGGNGEDFIIGGLGQDQMSGGAGMDMFIFNTAKESSATQKNSDFIADFNQSEGDFIYLYFDADTKKAGDQDFTFIGSKTFSKDATAQVRFDSATSTIYGSTNADAKAEFAIVVTGVTTMVASDFSL